MEWLVFFLCGTRQAHLVSPKDRQVQGKEGIIFLGQDGSLTRGNGTVHPVNALVRVFRVAHGAVNASHIVQEGQQEDKDFFKVRLGPGSLKDHVGFAVALESHLEVTGLTAANPLAVVAQSEVVEEDGGQAGFGLVAAFTSIVFNDRGKVKGAVVDHEKGDFVVESAGRGKCSSGGLGRRRSNVRDGDATNRDKFSLLLGSGGFSRHSSSSDNRGTHGRASALLGGWRSVRVGAGSTGSVLVLLLEALFEALDGRAQCRSGRCVVSLAQVGDSVVVEVQDGTCSGANHLEIVVW